MIIMRETLVKTRLARKNLLLPELIIATLFFAIAAAACVGLFAEAYTDINKSRDLTAAIIEAQNAAECFKAADGDLTKTAEFLVEAVRLSTVIIEQEDGTGHGIHKSISDEYVSPFEMQIKIKEADGLTEALITVTKPLQTEPIYKITAVVPSSQKEAEI